MSDEKTINEVYNRAINSVYYKLREPLTVIELDTLIADLEILSRVQLNLPPKDNPLFVG